MIKHKWNNENICIYCGLKRERKTNKLLMAITDFPPYNHYKYESLWYYTLKDKGSFNRPDCPCFNKKGFNNLKNKFDKALESARKRPLVIKLKTIDEILNSLN